MLSFFKTKSKQGWLAVVMNESRADFVHVRRQADGLPQVMLAESIEHSGAAAALLTGLRRPMELAGYRCTTLLLSGKYQLIQTEAAEGEPDEAREAVRWRLKDQVDFAVDSAAIDLLPIPVEGRTPQIFAAIAPESSVAPLIQAFQHAKVRLSAIDLPEFAQRNLAALFEQEGRGVVTLMFDERDGLLTFTKDGELILSRRVETSARQLISAESERRTMLFERIALDLQRSLDNFDRVYSSVPLSKVLVAPIPGVDGFVDYLRSNLTLPVVAIDLATVLDFSAVPALLDPLRQFQCLRAIGAALRDETTKAAA
ncbi:MAG TPA: hypothetical protein VJ001_11185 [Rhodocyclaceae bacterium]|nr:hypothetical protein [Rhodocyclaceae bacterium]